MLNSNIEFILIKRCTTSGMPQGCIYPPGNSLHLIIINIPLVTARLFGGSPRAMFRRTSPTKRHAGIPGAVVLHYNQPLTNDKIL